MFIGKSTHLSYCLTGHLTLRVVPTYTVARPPTFSFTTCKEQKGVKTFARGMVGAAKTCENICWQKASLYFGFEMTETGVNHAVQVKLYCHQHQRDLDLEVGVRLDVVLIEVGLDLGVVAVDASFKVALLLVVWTLTSTQHLDILIRFLMGMIILVETRMAILMGTMMITSALSIICPRERSCWHRTFRYFEPPPHLREHCKGGFRQRARFGCFGNMTGTHCVQKITTQGSAGVVFEDK